EVTFELDLVTALWRRDFSYIEYKIHDELSPNAVAHVADAALKAVVGRIAELSRGLATGDAGTELDVKKFLEELDEKRAQGTLVARAIEAHSLKSAPDELEAQGLGILGRLDAESAARACQL